VRGQILEAGKNNRDPRVFFRYPKNPSPQKNEEKSKFSPEN